MLKSGEIIEEGDHDALMAQGGHYADIIGIKVSVMCNGRRTQLNYEN